MKSATAHRIPQAGPVRGPAGPHVARALLASDPVVLPGPTNDSMTDQICGLALRKLASLWWWIVLVPALALTGLLLEAICWLFDEGVGIWGIDWPVAWGFAIINYVWWIAIASGGTFISALFYLVRVEWRTSGGSAGSGRQSRGCNVAETHLPPAHHESSDVSIGLVWIGVPVQASPRSDMEQFHARELHWLDTSDPIEASGGGVHISIEDAMLKVAREGIADWPHRDEPSRQPPPQAAAVPAADRRAEDLRDRQAVDVEDRARWRAARDQCVASPGRPVDPTGDHVRGCHSRFRDPGVPDQARCPAAAPRDAVLHGQYSWYLSSVPHPALWHRPFPDDG